MTKPQLSEAAVFGVGGVGEGHSELDDVAELAGGLAVSATEQAGQKALEINRLLRDKLGLWVNGGLILVTTEASELPYDMWLVANNVFTNGQERTSTDVVVLANDENGYPHHQTRVKLDTIDALGGGSAATLTLVDEEAGENYKVSDLDPAEQAEFLSVIDRLRADIDHEFEAGEDRFWVNPIPEE